MIARNAASASRSAACGGLPRSPAGEGRSDAQRSRRGGRDTSAGIGRRWGAVHGCQQQVRGWQDMESELAMRVDGASVTFRKSLALTPAAD